MLAPGTRFAYTNRWVIDVNDYGAHYWEIYHVVSSTAKSMLLLGTTVFHGNVQVEGNEKMDKVVQAHATNLTQIMNQSTTPFRKKLYKDEKGDYFTMGQGTALRIVRLNGSLSPVTYLYHPTPSADKATVGKKRVRGKD